MSQPEAAQFNGNWKALFVCPNKKIIRDLAPLLIAHLPNFSGDDVNTYPSRHQIADLLATHNPNLCFIEVTNPPDKALSVIPDFLRIDPKLPIIVVLAANDPELVLKCLRQGASDFLIQP